MESLCCLGTYPPPCRVVPCNIPLLLTCSGAHCRHSLEYSNHSNGLAVWLSDVGSCWEACDTACCTGLAMSALASIHSASVIGLSEMI